MTALENQENLSSKEDLQTHIKDLSMLNDFSLMLSSIHTMERETLDKIVYFCGNIFKATHCGLILQPDKKDEYQILSAWEMNNVAANGQEKINRDLKSGSIFNLNKPSWIGMRYTSDSPLGIALMEAVSEKPLMHLSDAIFSSTIIDSLGEFNVIFDIKKTYLIPLHHSGSFFGFIVFKSDNINSEVFKKFSDFSKYISQLLSSALHNARLYKTNTEIKYYLSNLIQNSRDAIISLDLSGKIILWNDGAENIFGYKEDDILGKNFYYLFSSESRSKVTGEWIELLTGRIIMCEEAKGLRKDGGKISVSYTLSPINDISDNIAGISIIFRDLTDKKQLEVDISESKGRLQTIFDSIYDHIVLFDLEHNILMANKIAINFSGLTPRELIGSKSYTLLEKVDINGQSPVTITINTRKQYIINTITFDDKSFNLKTFPVLDSIGKMTGIVLQAREIKE